jgi:RNA polymerase sigma-70 factor (ECF subfamily)
MAEDPFVAASRDDEARLIERLVAHDERAFYSLVRAYERRVFALVLRMVGDRAEAEDLAQEVFVQVFRSVALFRGDSKLSTWIFRIAVNLCKNRNKYLRIHRADAQQPLEGDEGSALVQNGASTTGQVARPDEMMAGRQVEQIVQRAILELEPSFRECLLLRDVEDMSYEEIASVTGLPEGTVKSRIHRARAQLRDIVEGALGEKIK